MDTGRAVPHATAPWRWIVRALYVLSLLAFLLPFATVKSCSTQEVSEYTGVELVRRGGTGLTVVLALALAMLMLSFVRRTHRPAVDGLCHAGRAFGAGCALLLAMITVGMQFLFDATRMRIGLYLCAGAWALVGLLSLGLAWRAHVRMLGSPEVDRARVRRTLVWSGILLAVVLAALSLADPPADVPERIARGGLVLLLGVPLAAMLHFAVMVASTRSQARALDTTPAG